jgi:hypothetical protein
MLLLRLLRHPPPPSSAPAAANLRLLLIFPHFLLAVCAYTPRRSLTAHASSCPSPPHSRSGCNSRVRAASSRSCRGIPSVCCGFRSAAAAAEGGNSAARPSSVRHWHSSSLCFGCRSRVVRYAGSSAPQAGAASASDEKNYLSTVFSSKAEKAAQLTHQDFSAAIAKEARSGILKVRSTAGCVHALRKCC